MRERRNKTVRDNKILVDANTLAEMLSVGMNTARKIGMEAGAKICFGRSVRYDVRKIEQYVATLG